MTRRPALPLATALAIGALAGPAPAAAQTPGPVQPLRYLLASQVTDARAVWLNPAGLARHTEASLGADLTAVRFPGGTEVAQYGATLASRGLAFGWSHDRSGGVSGNSYAVGLGLGNELFSGGATRRWTRGPVHASFWDLAAHTDAAEWLHLSVVARNLDSPTPRDSALAPSLVPGVDATLPGGFANAGLEWDVATSGWKSRAWRFGATVALWGGIALAARADLAPNLSVVAFTLVVHLEAPKARASAFAQLPTGSGGDDAFGVAGALVARRTPSRP